MPFITATDHEVAVSFDGIDDYLVLDQNGNVTRTRTVWGEDYSPDVDTDAAIEEAFTDGREHGYDDGYDAAMSKLHELLADIPEAIAILDIN